MRNATTAAWASIFLAVGLTVACGSSDEEGGGSGGSSGSGGTGTGGASGSGGSTSTGGAAGSTSTGGAAGSTSTGGAAGSGTGGSGTGGSGTGGSGTGGSGTGGSGTGGSGTGGSGTGGSGTGGTGSCASPTVDIVYGLTGTTFEITDTPLNAGNQVNTVATPYTDNNHIGPGTITLRFTAPNGDPGNGRADVIDLDLDLDFTVVATGTNVRSDLQVEVKPTDCSGAQGTLTGGTLTWQAPGLDPYRTFGNVTCTGGLCGVAGLPNGQAQPRDDSNPQTINDFAFQGSISSFTMSRVLVSQDQSSKTWLALKGTEVSRSNTCACP